MIDNILIMGKITKGQLEHGLKKGSGMGAMSINDLAKLAAKDDKASTFTKESDSAKTERSALTPGNTTMSHRQRRALRKTIAVGFMVAVVVSILIFTL